MIYNLLFVANDETTIAAAQEIAPDDIGNSPRLNADESMGLWALPASMLTDPQRAGLIALGVQVLDYDTAIGGDWHGWVVPAWVEPE